MLDGYVLGKDSIIYFVVYAYKRYILAESGISSSPFHQSRVNVYVSPDIAGMVLT